MHNFNPAVKTLIGIFLLICLILPSVGTYSWLQYQKSKVRKEVKERMSAGLTREELVLRTFTREQSETELQWEHSGEFEYKDEMYDVVETEVRGDSVFFWCWLDRGESGLNRRLENLITLELGHNPQNRETQRNLDNLSLSPCILEPIDWKTPNSQGQTLLVDCPLSYSSIHHSPPVPPPERA